MTGTASLNQWEKRTGIHATRISRFIRGKRGLTLKTVDRIAALLGLELRPAK
jgi:plasmid maintenance system antidote protein VapI